MNSIASSHRVPMPILRPKKSRNAAKKTTYTPIPPMPPITHSSTSTTTAHIKKPMRPLTAYHIFFQIEREYIIQTTAGPDANKSIHDNKHYIHNVPRRYRLIKLLTDWFAGPGKRQKRKHRKSHGKIGFLELSRVISKRWATLESVDPETKRYVGKIAAKELDEYKLEMKEYKELISVVTVPTTTAASVYMAAPAVSAVPDVTASAMIFPSPTFSSSSYGMPPMQYCMPLSADLVLSLDRDFSSSVSSCVDEDEIDYSICSVGNNGNYIPSPGPAYSSMKSNMIHPDGSICDPLFELENNGLHTHIQQPYYNMQRCVSPVSSNMSVDTFSDTYFCQPLPR